MKFLFRLYKLSAKLNIFIEIPKQSHHFYIKKRKKSVIAQNTSTHFLRIITIPDSTLINHHFPYPPIFLSNNVHTLLRL